MAKRKASVPAKKTETTSPTWEVSDRVQLVHIFLAEISAKRAPRVDLEGKSVRVVLDTPEVGAHAIKDQHALVVTPRFTLSAHDEAEVGSGPTLTIDARYIVMYSIKNMDGLTDEQFDEFARTNGVFHAWPYWREFVQGMTSKMGLKPYTLPVYRVPTSKRKEIEK